MIIIPKRWIRAINGVSIALRKVRRMEICWFIIFDSNIWDNDYLEMEWFLWIYPNLQAVNDTLVS